VNGGSLSSRDESRQLTDSRVIFTRAALALFLLSLFALVARWQSLQVLALAGMASLGAVWVMLGVLRVPEGGRKPTARSGAEAGAFMAIGIAGAIAGLTMPGAVARASAFGVAVLGFVMAGSWLVRRSRP
jgi:hypothetical protein